MALSFRRTSLLSRLKGLIAVQRFEHTVAESGSVLEQERGKVDTSRCILDSRTLGITGAMVSPSSYTVLQTLKNAGFEAYLVGGCVRDLILNKVPKDFDVVTTAELRKIKQKFKRAVIVGKRFPICLVPVEGSVIEVSNFQTREDQEKKNLLPQMPQGFNAKDIRLWSDAMRRDFTVNSLFFDPLANKIYDYCGAIKDLKSLKLQTLIPAQDSFEEDCARILRGFRIAARIGLSISKEVETAIYQYSRFIEGLPKSRLMMEMNYMLSYGAAEASISLLWRFNLLTILLPIHNSRLSRQIHGGSTMSSLFLMRLFSSLDKLVACDRPCHSLLWVAILTFHLALLKTPQSPLVIWTFGHLLYNENWSEGVEFARKAAEMSISSVADISESFNQISNDELIQNVAQLARTVKSSVRADLIENINDYAFISKNSGNLIDQLFSILAVNPSSLENGRSRYNIDYVLLGKGKLAETRLALGKIILDTMSSYLSESDGNFINNEIAMLQKSAKIRAKNVVKSSSLFEDQNVKRNRQNKNWDFDGVKNVSKSAGRSQSQVLQNEKKDKAGAKEAANKNQQDTKVELGTGSKVTKIDPVIHSEAKTDPIMNQEQQKRKKKKKKKRTTTMTQQKVKNIVK